MGFKRSNLLLKWPEGSEFFGLEVRMRRLSIRQLSEVQGLADLKKNDDVDTVQVFDDLLDDVADGLISWNYEAERPVEIDGVPTGEIETVPVPATREGLGDCDVDMVLQLVRAWISAAAAVPLASPPTSPTGAPDLPDAEWASWAAMNQESSPAPA